ncbi:DNA breaking-rejoining protein [Salmonella enterica subsp. enterica]|nr:DNA breaking-rejoining protein [Salmonella enterica subsp. enterica]EDP8717564.1 DNA breaking-rejoining protein [Salmonella enterica subsp. enterica]
MANPFDRLSTRMDEVTAARFGRPVLIDGAEYVAAEATFTAELGALSGEGMHLIVFSPQYRPARKQAVLWQGQDFTVTRWQRVNGKYQISLE